VFFLAALTGTTPPGSEWLWMSAVNDQPFFEHGVSKLQISRGKKSTLNQFNKHKAYSSKPPLSSAVHRLAGNARSDLTPYGSGTQNARWI